MIEGKIQIKKETFPTRCEICHQADRFDPISGVCIRCQSHLHRCSQPEIYPSTAKRFFDSSIFIPILGTITPIFLCFVFIFCGHFSFNNVITLVSITSYSLAAWWRWFETRYKKINTENGVIIILAGGAINAILSLIDKGLTVQFYIFFFIFLFLTVAWFYVKRPISGEN